MKIKIKWKFKTGKAVQNLADFDALIARSLVTTISKTLVRAIEQRYSKNKRVMGKIEQYPEPIPSSLTDAQREKLDNMEAALEEARLERISRFHEVIALIANENYYQIMKDDNKLIVGVGYIPSLDEIRSPSATPVLYGRSSRSPYGILWRQMEFGMGVTQRKQYPLTIENTRSTSSRGWWYGPKTAAAGIHFKGTLPGNLLRDQTGLPYSAEAAKFHDLFHAQFKRLLNG